MSCFGCCGDDDARRDHDGGGPYMVNNVAGNAIGIKCTDFFFFFPPTICFRLCFLIFSSYYSSGYKFFWKINTSFIVRDICIWKLFLERFNFTHLVVLFPFMYVYFSHLVSHQ